MLRILSKSRAELEGDLMEGIGGYGNDPNGGLSPLRYPYDTDSSDEEFEYVLTDDEDEDGDVVAEEPVALEEDWNLSDGDDDEYPQGPKTDMSPRAIKFL